VRVLSATEDQLSLRDRLNQGEIDMAGTVQVGMRSDLVLLEGNQ
jgi:hypothetical protein